MCLQESAMSEKKLTAKKRPRRQEDEFDHFASFTKPKKRVCLDEIGKSLQGSGYQGSAASLRSSNDGSDSGTMK